MILTRHNLFRLIDWVTHNNMKSYVVLCCVVLCCVVLCCVVLCCVVLCCVMLCYDGGRAKLIILSTFLV